MPEVGQGGASYSPAKNHHEDGARYSPETAANFAPKNRFIELQKLLADPDELKKLKEWASSNPASNSVPFIVQELQWLAGRTDSTSSVMRFLGKALLENLQKHPVPFDRPKIRDRIVKHLDPVGTKRFENRSLDGSSLPLSKERSAAAWLREGLDGKEFEEALLQTPRRGKTEQDRQPVDANDQWRSPKPSEPAPKTQTSDRAANTSPANDSHDEEPVDSYSRRNSHEHPIATDISPSSNVEEPPPPLESDPPKGFLQKLKSKFSRPALILAGESKNSDATAALASNPAAARGWAERTELATTNFEKAFAQITDAGSISSILNGLEREGPMHTRTEIASSLLPYIFGDSRGHSRDEWLAATLTWLGGSRMSDPVIRACIEVAANAQPNDRRTLMKALGVSLAPDVDGTAYRARGMIAELRPIKRWAMENAFGSGIRAVRRPGSLVDVPGGEPELGLALVAFSKAVKSGEGPELLERRLAVMAELPGRGEATAAHERTLLKSRQAALTEAELLSRVDTKREAGQAQIDKEPEVATLHAPRNAADDDQRDHKHAGHAKHDPASTEVAATRAAAEDPNLLFLNARAYGKQMAVQNDDERVVQILSTVQLDQTNEWRTKFVEGWIDSRKSNGYLLSGTAERIAWLVINRSSPAQPKELIEQVVRHVHPDVRQLTTITINAALSPAPRS